MSGPFKRRPSLKTLPSVGLPSDAGIRRASIRRQSSVGLKTVPAAQQEVPWDMLDRCTLPVLFCHASAIILSTTLNVLRISDVSTFTLFIWFTIVTIGAVLFYHNLKNEKSYTSRGMGEASQTKYTECGLEDDVWRDKEA
ncbi:unnamed protein product [Acanthoscelides obtectus]|uniref:Uncharacterized protein n=1 Tax=Acanthoscelides obtectus TaxID=200917 RepID=A0A9P0K8G8_ACAOB|nr:unnamed protein product [Acanthoscelides obtectus]CAK1632388.1 hypothetical protein AOBTE_LOCUS7527 [Acanthoscelides obtectus]